MENYKTLISVIATIVGIISYIPYITGTIKGKLKPSAVTWSVWGLLSGVAFIGQLSGGGGAGTAATAISGIASISIAVIALRDRESRKFNILDQLCLAASIASIVLWPLAHNPLLSIEIITAVTLVGYIPTYTKSFRHPEQENISLYLIGVVKFSLASVALSAYTTTTLLYPIAVVVSNISLITLLLARRMVQNSQVQLNRRVPENAF